MHPAFSRLDHRPWPPPASPFHWRQSWLDLLFAHWRIDARQLQPLVPEPLQVQEFAGSSWIGVVPFRMQNVMLRGLPNMPWISAFPELNLRIYVEHNGKPGVWFLSLDAGNPLAVWAARRFWHLPYYWASMALANSEGWQTYASQRKSGPHPGTFRARYRPISAPFEAERGTLEHWLIERYCLYAQAPDGTLYSAEVHHHPWPLQQAEAEIFENRLPEQHGLALGGAPDLLHFSQRLDVAVWNLERLSPR